MYFSLWYFNKQNQQRWIDLEKPLKKQLDKYGQEPTVYFGVIFYVPTVSQLQQEITRWLRCLSHIDLFWEWCLNWHSSLLDLLRWGTIQELKKSTNDISCYDAEMLSNRYQYYLQLKKDVLEGRIPCSIEQAIRLAGLAVQGILTVYAF